MAGSGIRNNKQNVAVQHRSARGSVARNSSTFTRGSQLLVHEFLMTFSGIKIPFLIWLGTFIAFALIMLSILMGQNENQLVLMRGLSVFWDWVNLNGDKLANLTVKDGTVHQLLMLDIPKHPEVVAAWNNFTRAIEASFIMSLCFGVPLGIWFVSASRKRGSNILEERHERGALLVDLPVLQDEVRRHNITNIKSQLKEADPPISVEAYEGMSIDERVKAGLHQPYTIAGVQYPWRTEQSHTMMIGTTGTGKTTQLRDLVRQMRERGCRAVIFDLTGSFVESFYNEKTDTILNPLDERCPKWSIFADCKDFGDFSSAAEALIPSGKGGGNDPFWPLAARTLLVEFCLSLVEEGKATNRDLAEKLMFAELGEINKRLKGTIADPLTSTQAAKMAESIRAVLNTHGQTMLMLPDTGKDFSINEWMTGSLKSGSILFITSQHSELVVNRSILTLWMDLAVNALMKMPRTRDLRTWFLFDEVHALHRLPAIDHGLQTARGFGGAFVLGMHSFDKLAETYGEEGAVNLSSLARTKLILATADKNTAEKCSDWIGQREVRQMEEGYTYGNNSSRDASTLTPRKLVEPLVLPDDISNLPSLEGFVKFPDGFPAAHIQLQYVDYPIVAKGFMRTERKRLTRPKKRSQAPEDMPDEKQWSEKDAAAALHPKDDAIKDEKNDNVVYLNDRENIDQARQEEGKANTSEEAGNSARNVFGRIGSGAEKGIGSTGAKVSHDPEQQEALKEAAKRQAEMEEDDSMRREIREGAVAGDVEKDQAEDEMEMD